MSLEEINEKRVEAESFYWLLVLAFFCIAISYHAFIPQSLQVRHTYEFPVSNCANRLTSDRWTWEFIREGLFVLFWFAPITGLFLIWCRSKTGMWLHIVVLAALLLWGLVNVGYDIENIGTANLPPNDVRYNPSNLANDRQWCLVYGGQPGTELVCAIVAPCPAATSAVSFEDLHINGPFSFRVAVNAFFTAFCLVDLIFTAWLYRNILNAWDAILNPVEQEEEKKPPEEKTTTDQVKQQIPSGPWKPKNRLHI